MKLTITKIFKKDQISKKTNKPFVSLSLKTKEYADRYLSGFGSKETESWKEGTEIDVEVTESETIGKDGKPYLNWKLPKKAGDQQILLHVDNVERKLKEEIELLRQRIYKLELKLEVDQLDKEGTSKGYDYPEMEEEPNFDVN